jgi:invasion protein IalB
VRRLSFVTCGPQQCVAEALIDEAFVKEAAANTKATITVHTAGGVLPFELAINGIDKALTYSR